MLGSRKLPGAIVVAVTSIAAALSAAPAVAADWRAVGTSCVNTGGTSGCAARPAFGGAWNVVVSPDGRHAYVAAWSANAVHVLDRDAATGALTPKAGAGSCVSDDGSGGLCTDVNSLTHPDGIVVSPDGAFVYVASWDGAIAAFSRNANTGVLTQLPGMGGCLTDTAVPGCVDAHGLAATRTLLMSPDGRHVYAGSSPIAIFDRDAASGVLTQKLAAAGCVALAAGPDGCDVAAALATSRQSAMSPDGLNLYFPNNSGVTIFDRDPVNGAISQKAGTSGCITRTGSGGACAAEPRLNGVLEAVTASPNGAQIYATMSTGIATLRRGAGGALTLQSCITDPAVAGCAHAQNVTNLIYSAVSPDGADVVANHSSSSGGLIIFSRDPASGSLTARPGPDGCTSADGSGISGGATVPGACRSYPPMGNHGHVAFVNNFSLVAGFFSGSTVASFKRDFIPQCVGRTVAVPHDALVAVPLACSDGNGDPLTLSIAQPPLSGSVGAIDAARSRVNYSPFGGFSGADSFTYQATGAGITSPPARVTLNVATGALPPPPRITSKIRVTWGVSGKRIFLLRLSAGRIPKGGKLELRCKGDKCPFKRRSSTKRRSGRITLFKEIKPSKVAGKKARKFRAKQRLEVRITAPTYIGKVVRYKLKKGKIPSGKTLCLPVGANKPRSRCT